jgi:hypothetical protein
MLAEIDECRFFYVVLLKKEVVEVLWTAFAEVHDADNYVTHVVEIVSVQVVHWVPA